MAVEGLIRKPPLVGTQLVELPTPEVTQLVAKGEEIISLEDKAEAQSEGVEEEKAGEKGLESLVCEEDFEIFYHLDVTKDTATTSASITVVVSDDQKATEVLEGMVIEKRLLDLLPLLESHARDATPKVPVVPRPQIPAPLPPIQIEPTDNKRKRDKKVGKGTAKEGEIQEETLPEQSRGLRATRSQQRKRGEVTETILERRSWILSWNPPLVLD